ncbi:MAG TPA: hypothetical protein VNW99_10755 [Cytophagaceae bacterium]|jgi:hypothetical protein|nr:hypothetical protein [Cytophagaceae bacterium]
MNTTQDLSIKEVYFQLLKTPEGFNAIDIASKEIVEKGSLRKELITKIISKLKKQRNEKNECKAYFLSGDNKVILSRVFKARKYSRLNKVKKSAVKRADQVVKSQQNKLL